MGQWQLELSQRPSEAQMGQTADKISNRPKALALKTHQK
jgi:hypothetical protein